MERQEDSNYPVHVAIIIDGNGRWAKKNGESRSFGYQSGSKVVLDMMLAALELHIKYFTIYAFSLENWKRPKEEVDIIMRLIHTSIDEEVILKHNIRFKFLGKSEMLPPELNEYLHHLESVTGEKTEMVFTVCISYSSKSEITDAVKALFNYFTKNKLDINQITENEISRFLSSNFLPNPDLIIRTGGEYRLSNFMLWQSAYSELYFLEKYWPDFNREDLLQAIQHYQKRERRYGGV
ncbi:MAG: di-trans,poly-cis-decaprenylcistransferase [Prevotellaceae bacterium]|jgi:undecaprenyl diphosphate synthase|nr:di-trans,poly-cis-decaprenylcistransferase [Prevotellaceae bacterium]